MMQLNDVRVVLDDKTILRSINLHWSPGESIALVGANGAGKSTLLKIVATLLKPSLGEMVLPGNMGIKQWRQSVGAVFPQTFLYDAMTAMENLQYYAHLYNVEEKTHLEILLKQVGLYHVRHDPIRVFSKGMKQRLSIARALVHQPKYLLLDEPFDGLDANSVDQIKDLLVNFKKEGVGWILVSHDVQQAWMLCDRVVLLHQGHIDLEMHCKEQSYSEFIREFRRMVKESPYAVH
jgi:heme exporter protein A